MEVYLQASALVLIAVILGMVLDAKQKVYATLLSLGVCTLVCVAALGFLSPLVQMLQRLRDLAGISDRMFSIVLKVSGVGLVSELAGLICSDGGNSSMGKAVKLMSNAVILWLSLPLFEQLLDLLQEVLGGL